MIVNIKYHLGVVSGGLIDRLLTLDGLDPSIAKDKKSLGKAYLAKIESTKDKFKSLKSTKKGRSNIVVIGKYKFIKLDNMIVMFTGSAPLFIDPSEMRIIIEKGLDGEKVNGKYRYIVLIAIRSYQLEIMDVSGWEKESCGSKLQSWISMDRKSDEIKKTNSLYSGSIEPSIPTTVERKITETESTALSEEESDSGAKDIGDIEVVEEMESHRLKEDAIVHYEKKIGRNKQKIKTEEQKLAEYLHRDLLNGVSSEALYFTTGKFPKIRVQEIDSGLWGKFKGDGDITVFDDGIVINGRRGYSTFVRWGIVTTVAVILAYFMGRIWPLLVLFPIMIMISNKILRQRERFFVPWSGVNGFVTHQESDVVGISLINSDYKDRTPVWFLADSDVNNSHGYLKSILKEKISEKELEMDRQPHGHGF